MTRSRCINLSLLLLFFVSFGCFAGNSYSQNLDIIRSDLASGNTELKRNALHQIKVIHTEEASRLAIQLLTDSNEIVRATAASAVIYLPKNDAATALIPLLNDKAEFVRAETAFALGTVADRSAASMLIRSLQKDRADQVRSAAAVALGKIGDISALDALTAVLKKKPSESDEFLRRSAAKAIGQIANFARSGNLSAVTPQNFLPSKYKEPETNVPSDPAFRNAVGVLTSVLKNQKESDDTRREAAFALGSIGDESSAGVLRSYLNSPDIYLAEICKEALIKLGQPQ
ncbi:MAG TPA: HEAT repeat domain-containing protein [Pyrinomonadaceae bacterium]|nr:HEAT repeat domain-containing protein [Pyrinomonadaceae bacterium]